MVDSGSKDRTLEIAQSFGAKTSFHAFGGHGEQKNVALDLCTSDWILFSMPTKFSLPNCKLKSASFSPAPTAARRATMPTGFRASIFTSARWIRHGGFYPDHKLRLFRRGSARLSEGVGPHSTPQFEGQRGKLKDDMLHYRLSHPEHLSRAHGPLQHRDRAAARRERPHQQIDPGLCVEHRSQPRRNLSL